MSREIEIDMKSETRSQAGHAQLPVNFITIGEVEPEDLKVYIRQDVYQKIETFSLEDTSKEVGSILVGDYAEELGKAHVIISGFIRAKHTDASASTLTFTHKTWEDVYQEQERLYPDKKIVGWQHTHPNYGIFLSNYDLFIQENFFSLPFQTAYVVDPIQGLRGFFQNRDGKAEKLKGFYIYDEIGKLVKIKQTTQKAAKPGHRFQIISLVMICCLLVSTISLAFFSVSEHGRYRDQLSARLELETVKEDQERVISDQAEELDQLQSSLQEALEPEKSVSALEDLIQKLESNEITLEQQDTVLTALKEFLEKMEEGGAGSVSFLPYEVQEGDTLISICDLRLLDYESYRQIICAVNGIENPNYIMPGQTILLPVFYEADNTSED